MIEPLVDRLPEPGLLIGSRLIPDASGGRDTGVSAATGGSTKDVPLAGPLEVDVGRLIVGHPLAETTKVGPLISACACDRILGVVQHAMEEESGNLVAGGHRMEGDLADGFYVAPTLFSHVEETCPVAREEVFGPVLSIMPFGQ